MNHDLGSGSDHATSSFTSAPSPTAPEQILFLPGATGLRALWQPVADGLGLPIPWHITGWPGFGDEPTDPGVDSFDDLVHLVLRRIDRPTALVAQSMGGVVALRAALACPERVTHLVLSVTSGGLDMAAHGATDWRPMVRSAFPHLPAWFDEARDCLEDGLASLAMPVLLLWGDADPLSPVSVGEALHAMLPHSTLHVVKAGGHDLASTHAQEVLPLIRAHLATHRGPAGIASAPAHAPGAGM
jgi:poly(3-hydroxyoctanoate) depolymerase